MRDTELQNTVKFEFEHFLLQRMLFIKYKIQIKQNKAKSLRKEIDRSQSDQQPRQE